MFCNRVFCIIILTLCADRKALTGLWVGQGLVSLHVATIGVILRSTLPEPVLQTRENLPVVLRATYCEKQVALAESK